MDTFLFAINAIMPLILLIVVGFVLKKIGFVKEDWLKKANTFVFKVCLPCLLFCNVYSIESFKTIDWSIVLFSEIAILAIFFIGMLVVKFTIKDRKQKGVILQCIFRSNFAIIGLSLVQTLGGSSEAIGIAALLSAFSIPTFNILACIALTMYINGEEYVDENGNVQVKKQNVKELIKQTLIKICKNPLIIGVVAGLVVLGIRALIPTNDMGEKVFMLQTCKYTKFIYTSINNISKIASPFALIILGGLFNFSAVKGMLKQIIIGTAARIVVVPTLVICVAIILSKTTSFINFDESVYPSFIALFASPVAVSSAIMAESMDNDGELAGQLVVWTSLFSIVTIFVIVLVLRSMALL